MDIKRSLILRAKNIKRTGQLFVGQLGLQHVVARSTKFSGELAPSEPLPYSTSLLNG